MNTITCPHCNKPFELTTAFKHELETEILTREQEKHARELEAAKKQAGEVALAEMKLLKEDMAQKEKQLNEARNAELLLRKDKLKLEDEKRSFELEKQRQLDVERGKIREKAIAEADEKQRLVVREFEMKIESMKKAVEEAQRKAEQGSQQMQGEAAELDLEQTFRVEFPMDSIDPVGKGVLGADISQTVKSPLGVPCGTILWESKRTKAWSDGWVQKLKSDLLSAKAHIPAIISEALPDEAKSGMGFKDGVWIASPKLAVALAMLLRSRLLDVAKQKKIAENKQTKAEELYMYVTSHDFQHQVEAMMETYTTMLDQITKERVSFERSWKLRETQVTRLMAGVSGIVGSMQGIAGPAMGTVKQLEFTGEDAQ